MPQIHKYGESKLTRIVMATIHHVTSGVVTYEIPGWLIFVGQSVPMF